MPQVPYSSVPTAESRLTPEPTVNVQTSPDMFGASLARALGQQGSAIENAGDEIFKRAQAMQQLNNESQARDAQAKYMDQQGQLHAQFTSQQGSAAGPQALNDYIQKSKDLRDGMRDGISSPAAQKMFDSDSLGFLGRNIFSAAGHSASSMKQYAIGTAVAQQASTANAAAQNPGDDLQFQKSLEETKANAAQLAITQGAAPDDPIVQNSVAKAVSNLTAKRIEGFTRTDPALANNLLDKALKDGSLTGDDIAKVQGMVQSKLLTVGPKSINDSINDGTSMVLGQSKVSMDRAADAIGGFESGGNYAKLGKVVDSGMYKGQQALGKYQVMPGNLPQWLTQAGLPQMTPQQFLANPQAQDQLFQKVFGPMMEKSGSFNGAANTWFTGSDKPPPDVHDGNGTTPASYLTATNAYLAKSASIQDKVTAGRAEATRIGGDVPGMEDATESRIIATHRQDEFLKKDAAQANMNTINTAIFDSRGQTPATIEQLRQDPKVSAAIDELPPKEQVALAGKLKAAQSQDNVPTPERDAVYTKLNSQAHLDPDAFKAIDPYNLNLTADQRKSVVGMQSKLRAGGLDDTPSVRMAVQQLGTQMTAAHISAKDDPEDYKLFTGALAQQIRDFKTENQRPPQAKDIDQIGARLLTERVTSKGYLWDTKEKPYAMTPPAPIAEKIQNQLGPDASEDQVRAEYVRRVYQSIARKQAAAGAPK